ncbi:hypothetical protein M8818_005351 [Zalaria obscura]|uniref:Uncharacterized protein n=1 Tax=Zalaria obscura TaxID=2024903 RepID=A0ACC3S940_9PEZI
MSSVAVASPYNSINTANYLMNPQPNDTPRGSRTQRKPNNKADKPRHQSVPQQDVAAYSDSNLPQNMTPKSRKQQQPRTRQNSDRAASIAYASGHMSDTQQRTRPASTAASNNAANMTPAKAAYAGPTFHASPAPSSLPMPKFFSKSAPKSGSEAGLGARMEQEAAESENKQGPSPDADKVAIAEDARNQQKSPLDMFFKADRQERAKRNSESGFGSIQAQMSPAQSRPSVQMDQSPSMARQHMSPSYSGKDIFMMEMDGGGSPARNSPQPQRSGLQSHRSSPAPDRAPSRSKEEVEREAQTNSLKAFLKVGGAGNTGSSTPERPSTQSSDQNSPFAQSPAQGQNPYDSNGSLHYGNRNLSPLFQAARNESPSRPSSLRQQVAYNNAQSPTANRHTQRHPQQQQQSQYASEIDPNSFSRNNMPQQAPPQNSFNPSPHHHHQQYQQQYQQQQQQHQQQSFPPAQAQSNVFDQRGVQAQEQRSLGSQSPDVKSMEDKLRGILKLGV